MRLLKFRVKSFRSVIDSGWIDCDEITTLIGTNEAGKSNVLLGLWKLNPAMGGKIDPIADYPRKQYTEIKNLDDEKKPVFVETIFELPPSVINEVHRLTGAPTEEINIAHVQRRFDGMYLINFPNETSVVERNIDATRVIQVIQTAKDEIGTLDEAGKTEEGIKKSTLDALRKELDTITGSTVLDKGGLSSIGQVLAKTDTKQLMKTSTIYPRFKQVLTDIKRFEEALNRTRPSNVSEARKAVLNSLPSFVYYSQYGNLDSEIYLPHVIENLKRDNLSGSAAAKARTLRVLFDFVGLNPQEIYSLGEDFRVVQTDGTRREPTEAEIDEASQKRKEREVLLQSASAKLTEKFRNWWKQGEYRFRFQADGDFFKIWVSDDKRPEEIELEGRSTGLQWFLSFYLIFLVESEEAHAGTILLLDEAGLSLHALAQKDLIKFFESLAGKNQIINSTHSPFLVDSNNLDRVYAVYVDGDGATATSPDLRANTAEPARYKSIYAVHAALGLSVSDVILQGCQPVIVEGTSDQFLLNGVKNFLIGEGKITPEREIVFMPAYGVKGIPAIASIVAGKDEELPIVIVDSDSAGRDLKNKLASHLYKGHEARIIDIREIRPLDDAEVEDLMSGDLIADVLSRYLKGPEEDFDESFDDSKPLIPQVEAYAVQHNLTLEPGWKVEVAKQFKRRLLGKKKKDLPEDATLGFWQKLFDKIIAN